MPLQITNYVVVEKIEQLAKAIGLNKTAAVEHAVRLALSKATANTRSAERFTALLTQSAVAGLFGIPQPHVSELRNYKLSRFSSERLLRFITLLDRDVEIIIRPKAETHVAGEVSVLVAA
jgi:predicted XRE-type DNA-binding protein